MRSPICEDCAGYRGNKLIRSKAQAAHLRLKRWLKDRSMSKQLERIEAHLQEAHSSKQISGPPVLFFNASSRIWHLSLNAAFNSLASWAVRLAGVKVVHAVCRRGMLQCMLGTRANDPEQAPPCGQCMHFSQRLYPDDLVIPLSFEMHPAQAWEADLTNATLQDMRQWEAEGLPVGELCLPTIRWALRRHNLVDDEPTRQLYRMYILSATNLSRHFERLIDELGPRALVVFNGITYPEAVAREVALRHGVSVVTHEVGLRPLSAFFSHGHATAYPIELPSNFNLSPEQNLRLDHYLEDRFGGDFTMAGIKFWPKIDDLPGSLTDRMNSFQQMAVVFTNVIFDTSQVHANTLFSDMFAWLDELAAVIRSHPETLFIFRAHPDEDRPGKTSRESVTEWVARSEMQEISNVYFLGPSDYASSYELIRQAKFTLIYNSSIGLEASIMGFPVLCAGNSRFTQIPIVIFPDEREAYFNRLEEFLLSEHIEVPKEFVQNARRFIYYQLFHASLDLSGFYKPDPTIGGGVKLNISDLSQLDLAHSRELRILAEGILDKRDFVYMLE